MESSNLQKRVWVYYPGHVGVCGNERAINLGSEAPITVTMMMGRLEILHIIKDSLMKNKITIEETT